MICLIALLVFAVLGLFSVKFRGYFFEAADCVFRKVTLRKCNTSFDQKMKMKISTRVTSVNKPLGGFVFKHFEVLSWIMTILMILSLAYSGYVGLMGAYNWVMYQNCNGPNSTEFCAYNALTGVSTPILNDANITDCNDAFYNTKVNPGFLPSGILDANSSLIK
ncbi:MAG: hypothetical protein AABW59_00875 [archaeon]